jgi:hypothetical protein
MSSVESEWINQTSPAIKPSRNGGEGGRGAEAHAPTPPPIARYQNAPAASRNMI